MEIIGRPSISSLQGVIGYILEKYIYKLREGVSWSVFHKLAYFWLFTNQSGAGVDLAHLVVRMTE